MEDVLLIIQIISILLSFSFVVLLVLQKSSDATKLMLVTCLCSLIQNAGYYLELTSTNLDEAMVAVRCEYIGTAFMVTMLMIFVFKYCRVKLLPGLQYGLVVLDAIVLLCVWLYKYVPFYYTSIAYVYSGLIPHLVLGKGFLYIIFAVSVYGEFIASAVVALVSALRSDDPNMKKNYWLLFFTCTVPWMLYICGASGMLEGYDTTPVGATIGIIIFGFAIIFRRVFDVVETAHENILMELDDAIIVLDYRRGFQEANRAAKMLFPELENTPYGQLVPSAAFNDLLDHKSQDDVEINGHYYRVHINELYARNGIDSNFIGYSIVLFDITESKQQLVKMTELRAVADSANQAKSAFLANVSHEIRTPINVVVGMSDVILRDYEDSTLLGYAQNIKTAANNLLELINDILDFSKIESGRVTLVKDDYRVDELFKDIIMVFRHRGDEKGLTFNTGLSTQIPKKLNGDAIRIKQIITNILTNAFKYTREGSVTFRAEFEYTDENSGNLIMSVEDTGIGIRKEELDKVFEMFVRLDERLNRSIEGTGLGLNITRKLVEQMGGEIKVFSEYGQGSTFTIIIPQIIVGAKDDYIGELDFAETVTKRPGISYQAPDAKVLIVDDSKTNLIVAKALLRDTKVKVTTVTSGEACIREVTNEHYDLIFLDHRMPIMDGVETLHKMQKMEHKCGSTPIIMLTANAIANAKDYYVREGFTDFLSKPICEESITDMLKKNLKPELIKEL